LNKHTVHLCVPIPIAKGGVFTFE